MDPILTIGIIMTIAGIVIIGLGMKRDVPNTLLWGAFPIFHGLHEFADYALDSLNAPFIVERFELLFAYGSSIALLAAVLEFNGGFPRPVGKITGVILFGFASYFFFTLSEENLESIEDTVINIGILTTNPHRLFFGLVMVLTSAFIVLITYGILLDQAKNGKLILAKQSKSVNMASIITLGIFSIFEGFKSENAIFINLRAISLAIFIILPVSYVLTNKPGLQRLLIIAESGELIYGYDFVKKTDIFDEKAEKELDNAVLTAGFLSAISGFSGQMLQAGKSLSIQSGGTYFLLVKIENIIISLQSISYSRAFGKLYEKFADIASATIKKQIETSSGQIQEHNPLKKQIESVFAKYY